MKIICAHCGKPSDKLAGAVNRAKRAGLRLFCDRVCAGLGRRHGLSKAALIERKRLYDAGYREKNRGLLKVKKHAHFKATYDPAKAAIERKARMHLHVEYCNRPEYKAWKREYDRTYRAKADFGPFWEAALVLLDIENEVSSRMSRYEIYAANGLLNKSKQRKRAYESSVGYRP